MPNDPAVPDEPSTSQNDPIGYGAAGESGRERLRRLALVDIDPSTLELITAVLTADVCDQIQRSRP